MLETYSQPMPPEALFELVFEAQRAIALRYSIFLPNGVGKDGLSPMAEYELILRESGLPCLPFEEMQRLEDVWAMYINFGFSPAGKPRRGSV